MRKIDTFYRLLFTALALYLIVLLLRYPTLSLEYASTGLNLWFTKMVPTLLPFMILSGIMIRMNLTESFVSLLHPLLRRIFGTSKNGSYTIIMGFLCGFPMGARIVGELCESNKLSREEGSRLLYFCNNIGPIYFLSYVVPTLAIDKPIMPLFIMYGIPLLYGLILLRAPLILRKPHIQQKNCKVSGSDISISPSSSRSESISLLAAIDASVLSGLLGIAKLGGYMVFLICLTLFLCLFIMSMIIFWVYTGVF